MAPWSLVLVTEWHGIATSSPIDSSEPDCLCTGNVILAIPADPRIEQILAWWRRRVPALLEHAQRDGIVLEQNSSDEKLETPFTNEGTSIWPLTGYEFSVLEIEKFNINKFSPFLSEGLGWIVTNGYSNSSWSRDFAIATGRTAKM